MESDSVISDFPLVPNPAESKSWVSTRFIVVEDCGIYKRRCRYLNCNKEYAKGTSHMILKRHWSKAHDDVYNVEPRSKSCADGNGGADSDHRTSTKKRSNKLCTKPKRNLIANRNSTPKKLIKGNKLQFEFKQVVKRLKEALSIHLTLEMHTPKKGGKTYGIITAHSLNESSKHVKSVLLDHRHLPYPSDHSTILEFLKNCINKFNCREKIISIASDGTDAVLNAVQEYDKRHRLSKNFNFSIIHIRCFPYFVHTNVNEVIRTQEVLIESIRKIVNFINQHNFTMRPIRQSDPNAPDGPGVEALTITNETDPNTQTDSKKESSGLKLPIDNRSSWDTIYHMIDTFSEQRGFIEPTLQYFQNTQELESVEIDWDKLYALIHLLRPFHQVISRCATEDYTPVSIIAALIPHLMDHLSNSQWIYEDIALAAHNFKLQLDLYRQQFQSDLTVIAGLLDARVKDSFTSNEGKEEVLNMLRKRVQDHRSPPPPPKKFDGFMRPDSIFRSIYVEPNPDEILAYMQREREPIDVDPISFWECYKYVYPSLYNLAKSLICVQASSVPSERMFSAAENVERDRKPQMDSSVPKELIRSWARYLEK
jgi:hypothetical protein